MARSLEWLGDRPIICGNCAATAIVADTSIEKRGADWADEFAFLHGDILVRHECSYMECECACEHGEVYNF